MFKKKAAVPDMIFHLGNGSMVKYKLNSLPIKEDQIISHSIEFFNDPSPCFIHRGAVVTRLCTEIENAVRDATHVHGGLLIGERVPEVVHRYLELEDIMGLEL